jgi:hypothetical protein
MIYESLSDFISNCIVAINEKTNMAVIVTNCVNSQKITLIGFEADPSLDDYSILEEGWEYYNQLSDELKSQ